MKRIDWLGVEIAHVQGKVVPGSICSDQPTKSAYATRSWGNFCICVKPDMNRATRPGVHGR